MTIFITGSNGFLGSVIAKRLKLDFPVVTLGRNDSDVKWTLGEIPHIFEIKPSDTLLHLAWSLNDRINDWDLNIGGTANLCKYFHLKGANVLNFSSMAIYSHSTYGKQKLILENKLDSIGIFSLRIGLVPEANSYKENFLFKRLFNVKANIDITYLDSIFSNITNILKGNRLSKTTELVDETRSFSDIFGKGLITVKPFHLNYRSHNVYSGVRILDNKLDAMYSLIKKG